MFKKKKKNLIIYMIYKKCILKEIPVFHAANLAVQSHAAINHVVQNHAIINHATLNLAAINLVIINHASLNLAAINLENVIDVQV